MSVTLTVFFDEPFWAELFERRDEGKVRACKVMVLDARYHNAWIAHLLERDGIQRVTGYRRHTYKGEHYGKYRFRYDPKSDEYIYPEKQRFTWKTTTREGYRQYCCEDMTCKGCARLAECFGASMSRKVMERHVWWDAADRVDAFTKTYRANALFTVGEKGLLNAPSRRPKRTTACAMRTCSGLRTCGNSAS